MLRKSGPRPLNYLPGSGPEIPNREGSRAVRMRIVGYAASDFDFTLLAAGGLIRLGHGRLCCKLVLLHVVVGLGPETPLLYTPRLTSDE
jgi:hypothetical protein